MKIRILILLISAIVLASCSAPEYKKAEGVVWGTTYHIVYKSDRDLSDSIVAEMRNVELALSMFDPASNVSQINARSTCIASPYLKSVMSVAKRVHSAAGGMFDPTVAPLVDLWGFGRKGSETPVPDSDQISEALSKVGLSRIRLSGDSILMPEGMELDFSAIAKGFGVDCVAAALRRNGSTDYMVEIGGEVSLSGVNTYGKDWRIMVESPVDSVTGSQDVLQLSNCAVATSGNYRNKRNISTDSVVGHTINPLTGYPMQTSVLSATVIAPSCVLADALATALMASGAGSAPALIKKFPATRAILYVKNESAVETVMIP